DPFVLTKAFDAVKLPAVDEPELFSPIYNESLFKHEPALPLYSWEPDKQRVPPQVEEDKQIPAGGLKFHGYDENFPFHVPKYTQRQFPPNYFPVTTYPFVNPLTEQPKVNKNLATRFFITFGKTEAVDVANLQMYRYKNGVRFNYTAIVTMHDSNSLFFKTPYLFRETQRDYTSFFYEIGDRVVYTWLPFIDPHSDVSYVVQVFVKKPAAYFKILYDWHAERLAEVKENRIMLINSLASGLRLQKVDSFYKVARYEKISMLPEASYTPEQWPETWEDEYHTPPVMMVRRVKNVGAATVPYLIQKGDKFGHAFVQEWIQIQIRNKSTNTYLQCPIGVMNDFREFFVMDFRIGLFDEYLTYIHYDKYGRRYAWLPFQEDIEGKAGGNPYLAQVWIERSETFVDETTTEHLMAKHSYYTLPERLLSLFKPPTYIEAPRAELYSVNNFYTLAISYVPTSCANTVFNKQFVLGPFCQNAYWTIHGLFTADSGVLATRRHDECQLYDWRPIEHRVQFAEQVPENFQRWAPTYSVAYSDDIAWWDRMWCVHGYFALSDYTDNVRRFANPTQYFQAAFTMFEKLDFENKLANLIIDDVEFQNASLWYDFESQFNPVPLTHKRNIGGNVIVAPYELRFCFDLNYEAIECSSVTTVNPIVTQPFRKFYLPSKYSPIDYIVLKLKYSFGSPRLRIHELIPPGYYRYIHEQYLFEREHHLNAFQYQVLTDRRYEALRQEVMAKWLIDPTLSDYENMKVIFRTAGLLMYELKGKFTTPLDYFSTITRLYDRLRAETLLDRFDTGILISIGPIMHHWTITVKTNKRVYFLCRDNIYLDEIRVCFDKELRLIVDCPKAEIRSKSYYIRYAEKTNSCGEEIILSQEPIQEVDKNQLERF
ncbi:hypothetical protein B4U80_13570, partial [Leptotrombidium deliense]